VQETLADHPFLRWRYAGGRARYLACVVGALGMVGALGVGSAGPPLSLRGPGVGGSRRSGDGSGAAGLLA
jgi:hypothetical protein